VISPEVVGDLTSAKTTFHSPYGGISVNWEKKDGLFTLQAEIPVNTRATVYLPFAGEVTVNDQKLTPEALVPGLTAAEVQEGKTICRVGSGRYEFKIFM
jgi:hypothetical protein